MERINIRKYQYVNKQDYCEITLKNKNGVTATILNYGATLEKFCLPAADSHTAPENMILSLPRPEDYSKARNFLGGTVGRIIGRMAAGTWQDGDTTRQFAINDAPNHAHGGPEGLDTQVFTFRVQQTADTASVILDLIDNAGHDGYPGTMHLTATYTLDDFDTLTYHLHAITDAKTLCNPANHAYFNLDGHGDVLHQTLQIAADNYLPLDQNSIPSFGMAAVARTAFDLRDGRQLGAVVQDEDPDISFQHGLNHPFILNGHRVAATLTSSDGKRRLSLTTTAPSIVVYTANHFNHTGVAANIGQYDGVALEAQFPPTADKTLNAITLLPGEAFNAETSWHIEY